MVRKTSSYREALLKRLADPEEAKAYLNAGLEDSMQAFLKALGNVIQAHPVTQIAKEAGVQRETLYRSFSEEGNPTLETLSSVLGALGFRIAIDEAPKLVELPTDVRGGISVGAEPIRGHVPSHAALG